MFPEESSHSSHVPRAIHKIGSAVVGLWHDPEFLWLARRAIEQEGILWVNGGVRAAVNNQQGSRGEEGNVSQRFHLVETISCAPVQQVIGQPDKRGRRHVQPASHMVVNHARMRRK